MPRFGWPAPLLVLLLAACACGSRSGSAGDTTPHDVVEAERDAIEVVPIPDVRRETVVEAIEVAVPDPGAPEPVDAVPDSPDADTASPCPPWAPVQDESACHGCTNSSHCPCGACVLSSSGGICVTSGEANCACSLPYPACTTVDGQVMCVECVGDDMCPTGCGCREYACVHPDGSACPRPLYGCKDPCAAAGCPDPEHRWASLACDVEAQCCVATEEAGCDNVYAFCTRQGSVCLHVRDIFGASFATWVSGDEACEPAARGYCTCDLKTRDACATGDPATTPGCCPPGQECIPGDELFHRLANDPAATPPLDVHDRGFCATAP